MPPVFQNIIYRFNSLSLQTNQLQIPQHSGERQRLHVHDKHAAVFLKEFLFLGVCTEYSAGNFSQVPPFEI